MIQGETCARIQSSKRIDKFVSPICRVITKTNLDLEFNSTILNKSHYDKGWIIIKKSF